MRRLIWLVVFVVIAHGGSLSGQSGPNFSGTWTAPSSMLTITQDATTLTVTEGAATRIYNLDGTPSRFQTSGSHGASQHTAHARWVQSALVIETTTISSIGRWTDLVVYSLDYGPRLSVVHVGTQTRSPMMSTTVTTYTRREPTRR